MQLQRAVIDNQICCSGIIGISDSYGLKQLSRNVRKKEVIMVSLAISVLERKLRCRPSPRRDFGRTFTNQMIKNIFPMDIAKDVTKRLLYSIYKKKLKIMEAFTIKYNNSQYIAITTTTRQCDRKLK